MTGNSQKYRTAPRLRKKPWPLLFAQTTPNSNEVQPAFPAPLCLSRDKDEPSLGPFVPRECHFMPHRHAVLVIASEAMCPP
jgi:hypothetical protein